MALSKTLSPLKPKLKALFAAFAVLALTILSPNAAFSAPFAATQPATSVTSSSATLNGMATPHGNLTFAWFEWGTNQNYNFSTAVTNIGSGFNVVRMSAQVTGLAISNRYECRLVVSNLTGVVRGMPQFFGCQPVVRGWGNFDPFTAVSIPANLTNSTSLAAGESHCLALKANLAIQGWGSSSSGELAIPAIGSVLAVASGGDFSAAIKNDRTVAAWGKNDFQQTNVPAGLANVVQISSGWGHSLALRADGSVAAWGNNQNFQTNVPAAATNIVAVAGGVYHSLALRNDGQVVAWGNFQGGATSVPATVTNVVAIAGGYDFSLALKGDGTVVAWGDQSFNFGVTNIPPSVTNVVAIVAGYAHCLALRLDGSVVAWGDNSFGQTNVIVGLAGVASVAGSQYGSFALGGVIRIPPMITTQPKSRTNNATTTATFTITASGSGLLSYQWFKNQSTITNGGKFSGAQTATLSINNVLKPEEDDYTVQVTNAFGTNISSVATLKVLDPVITTQPISQKAQLGGSIQLTAAASGSPSLSYTWRRDGTIISNSTTNVLTLTNVQSPDAGAYDVVVANSFGGVTSTVAQISVNLAGLDSFNPSPNSMVEGIALQPDGKILVGGVFSMVSNQNALGVARLLENGALDDGFSAPATANAACIDVQPHRGIFIGGAFSSFVGTNISQLEYSGLPNQNFSAGSDGSINHGRVNAIATQTDGKLVIAGWFTAVNDVPRGRIARIETNGALDMSFDPNASDGVNCLAIQQDGKILVGGTFNNISGNSRTRIARLNSDGTIDSSFNATFNGEPIAITIQPDRKILVGGAFGSVNGQSRNGLARLYEDGSLDTAFVAQPNRRIESLALQSDGKIVVGGEFSTLAGQPRNRIGRLEPDGSLDPFFCPDVSGVIYMLSSVKSLALQRDGRLIIGGDFSMVNGAARSGLARVQNTYNATEQLEVFDAGIRWLRGGSSPEVWRTTFQLSADGKSWTEIGAGIRIPGGWQITGVSVPASYFVRAQGFISSGAHNGSGWIVESYLPQKFSTLSASPNGLIENFTMQINAPPGQQLFIEASTNLTDWAVIATTNISITPILIRDFEFTNLSQRFYRVRSP